MFVLKVMAKSCLCWRLRPVDVCIEGYGQGYNQQPAYGMGQAQYGMDTTVQGGGYQPKHEAPKPETDNLTEEMFDVHGFSDKAIRRGFIRKVCE